VRAAELLDPTEGAAAPVEESSAVISTPGSAVKRPGGTVPDAIFPLTSEEVLAEASDDDAFSMLGPTAHDSADALAAPPSSSHLNSSIWRESALAPAPADEGPLQSSAVNLLAPGPAADPSGSSSSALATDESLAGLAGPSSNIFEGSPDSAISLLPPG